MHQNPASGQPARPKSLSAWRIFARPGPWGSRPLGPTPRDSQSLPQPDAAELRASVGAKATDYAVGDVIDDRFEILDILGQGGFSKVYRVRDDVEDEERALKLFDNARGYEAIRREISALRKIRHPNVVEVYWAGKTGAGEWYLITEFIEGEPLSEFVGGKRVLRDREAADVALDLLDALVAFHPDSSVSASWTRNGERASCPKPSSASGGS